MNLSEQAQKEYIESGGINCPNCGSHEIKGGI